MKQIIIDVFKKYKWLLILEIILIIANIKFSTYPTKMIGEIIDLFYNLDDNKNLILQKTAFIIISSIIVLILRTTWKYIEIKFATDYTKTLRIKLYEKLMKVHLEELKDIKNGQLMSYFVSDIKATRIIVTKVVSTSTRTIMTLIIVLTAMITDINLKLTLAIMIPIVITTMLTIILKTYVQKSFKEAQKNFTNLSEYVQESTDSIRTSKAYALEKYNVDYFLEKNIELKNSDNKLEFYASLLHITIKVSFGICFAISVLYGSHLVLKGEMTTGDLVAVNGYITLLINQMTAVPWIIDKFKRAQISYKRLDKVFNLREEKIKLDKPKNKMKIVGNIKINNLTYSYKGFEKEVLKNINLEIKCGKKLGIIGVLGSGKTTLANLLLRLYDVEKNKIFIDGKDINEIDLQDLRENICYITQDSFLFSTTLKENINLFRDEYNDDELDLSIEKAMIHEEIIQMPDKIDTVIGEKGVDLSGGQKQRVVISRAFLKNSRIVIFDDTFSALDNKTRRKFT